MDTSEAHSCTCECHECGDTLEYDEDCCVYLQPAPPTNLPTHPTPQGGRLGAVWAVEDECAALLRQLGEDAGAGGLSAPLHRTLSTLCRCVQLLASSSTDAHPIPPTPTPTPTPPPVQHNAPDTGVLRPMQADIEFCLERLEAIEERLHSGGGDRRNNKDVRVVGRSVDELKARVDAVEGTIDVLISEVHRGLASVDRKMSTLNTVRREAATPTPTPPPSTIAAPLAVHQPTTDGGGCKSAPGGLQWMRRHFPNAPLEAPIRWDEPPTHLPDGVQCGLLPSGPNLLVLRPGVYTLELVVVLSCARSGFAKASGKLPGPLAEVRWCVDGGSVWQSKGGTRHSINPSPLNAGEFPATSAHHDAVYTQVVSSTISLSVNAQSKIAATIIIDDLLPTRGGGGAPSRCDGCRSLQRPPAQQCALAQFRAKGNTPCSKCLPDPQLVAATLRWTSALY